MNKIKKVLFSLMLFLVGGSCTIFSACQLTAYEKVDFELSETTLSLTKSGYSQGESKTISAVVSNAKGDISKKVAFISSNPEIAYVESVAYEDGTTNAKIVAVAGGEAVVYAIAEGNIKKTINVYVEQEAQSISINSAYTPLIIKGEEFVFDKTQVVILPATSTDKTFSAVLYEGVEISNQSTPVGTVKNPLSLTSEETSALKEGDYTIRVSKQTSNATIYADMKISVRNQIDENSITLVDLEGNEIQSFELATNKNPNQQENLTQKKFRINYNGKNDLSDFCIFIDKKTTSFEISSAVENGIMTYTIKAAQKVEASKLSILFAYAGFEKFTKPVQKDFDVKIDTYPERIGYKYVNSSSFETMDELEINIYSSQFTDISFSNLPVDTNYRKLVLRLLSGEANLNEVTIDGEPILISNLKNGVEFNSGSVVSLIANSNRAGEQSLFEIYNAEFSQLREQFTVTVRTAVSIEKYYIENSNGEMVVANSANFVVGREREIYFVYNEYQNPYFEALNFVPSSNTLEIVSLEIVEIDIDGDGTTDKVGKLVVFATEKVEASFVGKNDSIDIVNSTFYVNAIVPIRYQDSLETVPEIYFEAENVKNQINVGSVSTNPNSNDVENISINSNIDSKTEKGKVVLNLKTYPENATVNVNNISVIKLLESGSLPAEENEIDVTFDLLKQELILQVNNSGWDAEYEVTVDFEYFNSQADLCKISKKFSVQTYQKLKFGDISIKNLNKETSRIELIDSSTAGDLSERTYKKLTLTIDNISEIKLPEVSISLSGGAEVSSFIYHGTKYNVVSGSRYTVVYYQTSINTFDFYVLAKSIGDHSRYSEFVFVTVVQDNTTFNKLLEVVTTKNKVASEIIVDGYQVDDSGRKYYIVEKGKTLTLTNYALPREAQIGLGYEVVEGVNDSYFYVQNNQIVSFAGGDDARLRIYAQSKRTFTEDAWIDFISGRTSEIEYQPLKDGDFVEVIVRCEDGSQAYPFSIFTLDDLKEKISKFKGTSSNLINYKLMKDIVYNAPGSINSNNYLISSIVNYINIDGNNHTIQLSNVKHLFFYFESSNLENLKFISPYAFANSINLSDMSNCEFTSSYSHLVSHTQFSNIENCVFYRDHLYGDEEYFAGILYTDSYSTYRNNRVIINTNNMKSSGYENGFGGLARGLGWGCRVENNTVEYVGDGTIQMGENGIGGLLLYSINEQSTVSGNTVLSYTKDFVNSDGTLAGLIYTARGTLITRNSVFANVKGAGLVENVKQPTNNAQSKIENCIFVGNCGENGVFVANVDLASTSQSILGSRNIEEISNCVFYNTAGSTRIVRDEGFFFYYLNNLACPLTKVEGKTYLYTYSNNGTIVTLYIDQENEIYFTDTNQNEIKDNGEQTVESWRFGTKTIIYSNFFVLDNTNGIDSAFTGNSGVIKLTSDGFKKARNFQSFDDEMNEYEGLALNAGNYNLPTVSTTASKMFYDVAIWTMTENYPVLLNARGEAIDLVIPTSLFLDKSSEQNIVSDNENNAYLITGITEGSYIDLNAYFALNLDGRVSKFGPDFDFEIVDADGITKEGNSRLKVNKFGYAKLKVYALTNPELNKEFILFVYGSDGVQVTDRNGNLIENNSTQRIRQGETFEFNCIVSSGLAVNVLIDGESKEGINGKYIVNTADKDEITINVTYTIVLNGAKYGFEIDALEFIIDTYQGAIDVSFSFSSETSFSKQDVVLGSVSITTDMGEIDIDELEEMLSIIGSQQELAINLPELSVDVLSSETESEQILGVDYTTTTFNLKFYFADVSKLIDYNDEFDDEGEYEINVEIDDISASVVLNLTPQEVQSVEYANILSSTNEFSQELVNDIQHRSQNYITPGGNSMLDIYVYPLYADFDEVILTSNTLINTRGEKVAIMFEQRVLEDDKYLAFSSQNNTSIINGIKLLRASNLDGTFDGHYYVRNILTSNESFYLENGSEFKLTLQMLNNGEVVYTKVLTLIVEVVPTVSLEIPNYVVAGIEFEVKLECNENINEGLSFVINDENNLTSKLQKYVSKRTISKTYSQGKWTTIIGVTVDYRLLLDESFENFDGAISVSASVTKQIRGIYYTHEEQKTFKLMKWMVDSIEIKNAKEVYLSNQTIDLNYKINAKYFEDDFIYTPKEMEYIKNIQAEIAQLEADINNNLSNLDFVSYFGEGQTWKFYKNSENEVYHNKLVTLVYNNNLNFRATFTFDYDGLTPKLINSATQRKQNITVGLNSYVNLVSDEDNPDPIESLEDFYNMRSGIHYRLLTNLKLSSWQPIDLTVGSFDGNGFIIYIDSFNIDLSAQTEINIGFLNTISENTIVKNVTLGINQNISSFNITNASEVNFGAFVVENRGSIYNCEVLAMNLANYNEDFTRNDDSQNQTQSGQNAVLGNISISVPSATSRNTVVGGFVAYNNGRIVNSRFGRSVDSFVYDEASQEVKAGVGKYRATEEFSEFVSGGNGFMINASGTIAGFAGENGRDGIIASSYVANVDIRNGSTDAVNSRTAGFVAENYNQINGCYVTGEKQAEDGISATKSMIWAATHIGGFVFDNYGEISDSLSNIKIITNALSAGFVYSNASNASVRQSISLSKNAQSIVNSPFTGHTGIESLQKGSCENCYYFDEDRQVYEITNDTSATPIVSTYELCDESNFNSFAFNSIDFESGIWYMTTEGYPALTSANQIAISNFELNKEASTADRFAYTELSVNTNPVTIDSASAWHKKMLNRLSNGENPQITGSYRLINNIDFAETAIIGDISSTANLTYFYDFAGKLDGNGLKINSLSMSTSDVIDSIGLFSSINKYNNETAKTAVVKNLTINFVKSASQNTTTETIAAATVKSVGGLAGIINNAKIYNINLLGNYSVYGSYFAGGLAGIIVGENTEINNVYSELSVKIANYGNLGELDFENFSKDDILYENNTVKVTATGLGTLNKKGFVGGVAGFVEIGTNNNEINIKNIKVSTASELVGTYVGGVFGYVSEFTYMHEIGFTVKAFDVASTRSTSHIVGYQVMGGLIAVNKGILRYGFVEHANQRALDTSVYDSTIINSEINLFRVDTNEFKNTTGENHDIYVGGLIGINIYKVISNEDAYDEFEVGVIRDSYSKVAVIPADINETYLAEDTDFVKLTTYAGGMIGRAFGGLVETSYTTAQVIADFSGGVVGRVSDDMYFENVIAMNSFVSGVVGMNFTSLNSSTRVYYPEEFYNTEKSTYYASINQIANYHIGGFVSVVDNENIEIYRNSQSAVGTENLVYVNKINNVETRINFVGFKFNNNLEVEIYDGEEPSSMFDQDIIKEITAKEIAQDAISYFADFKGISVADWVITEVGNEKILPYPNFGILLSKTIEDAEDFLEVKLQASLNYSVAPNTNDYTITLIDWYASSTVFTGSLIGIGRGDDQNNLIYPTIKVWLNNNQQYNSIFETLRGATIKNLNIEIYVNTQNESDEIYFGALASRAYNSKIENVNVSIIKEGESVSFSVGKVVESTGYIMAQRIKYFGGLIGYSENNLISGSEINLNLEAGASDADNVFGGVASQVKGGRVVANTVEITQESADVFAWCKIFGGVAGEALDAERTYQIESNEVKSQIDADGSSVEYIGGIVGINCASSTLVNNKFEISGSSCLYGSGNEENGLTFGGIAGENYGIIDGCYSYIDLYIAERFVTFGGIVGKNFGNVSNCECLFEENYGVSVENDNVTVGGIAGYSENALIQKCFTNFELIAVSDSIEVDDSNVIIGGIVADLKVTNNRNVGIFECFANCDIYLESSNPKHVIAGGLVGKATGLNDSTMANIKHCYVSGSITSYYDEEDDALANDSNLIVGGVVGNAVSFVNLVNIYSVCDVLNEKQVRVTEAENLKLGLIAGISDNTTQTDYVFGIKECNMELENGVLDASLVYIGEFYRSYNTDYEWNSTEAGVWTISNGLPTLTSLNLIYNYNSAYYAHDEGSRINPYQIDDEYSEYDLGADENVIILTDNHMLITCSDDYSGWLVSVTQLKTIGFRSEDSNFVLGSKGVISGINTNDLRGDNNLISYGKITYCNIGIRYDSSVFVKTISNGYYEAINFTLDGFSSKSSPPSGIGDSYAYFAYQISTDAGNYVLIRDITATGTANCGLINEISGSGKVLIENVALQVNINDNHDSGAKNIGALVYDANNDIVINNVYNTGKIKANHSETHIGGLIGTVSANVEISNSFNASFLDSLETESADSTYIAGIVGFWAKGNLTLTNVYSASMKLNQEAGSDIHGIVGYYESTKGTFTADNVYFARDLIFNDLYDNSSIEYGEACDYAELGTLFSEIDGWVQTNSASVFTLPYAYGMNIPTQNGNLFKPMIINSNATSMSAGESAVYLMNKVEQGEINSINASGFHGVLLGNNEKYTLENQAMFSSIGSGAKVIGFELEVVNLSKEENFGAVISRLNNANLYINNVQTEVNGEVSGSHSFGGLVGLIGERANGETTADCESKLVIYNSSTTGVVEADVSNLGGLVGYANQATLNIVQCYSTLRFNTKTPATGGFIGYISSEAHNNYLSGGATEKNTTRRVLIKNSYYAGTIITQASDLSIGGFVGRNASQDILVIENCYNAGYVFVSNTLTDVNSVNNYDGGRTLFTTNLVESANLWTSSDFANYNATSNLFEDRSTTKTWVWWNAVNTLPTLTWQYNAGGQEKNINFVYDVAYANNSGGLSLNDDAQKYEQIGVIKINTTEGTDVILGKNYDGNGFPIVVIKDSVFKDVSANITISNLSIIAQKDDSYNTTSWLVANTVTKDINLESIWIGGVSYNKDLSGRHGLLIDSVEAHVMLSGYNVNLISIYDTDVENNSSYIGGFFGEVDELEIKSGKTINYGEISGTTAGGFAGYIDGNLKITGGTNINYGSIRHGNSVGGFVGQVDGYASISGGINENYGTVWGTHYAGGFFGYVNSDKDQSLVISGGKNTNNGEVVGGFGSAGGFAGYLDENLQITGGINVNLGGISGARAGGFVGHVYDYVELSDGTNTNKGLIKSSTNGETLYAGGFVGYVGGYLKLSSGTNTNEGQIRAAYDVVVSNANNQKAYAGGFAGFVEEPLYLFGGTSTNSGSVTALSKSYSAYAGGYVGYINDNLQITGGTNTNSGNVTAISESDNSYAGGFAGYVGYNENYGNFSISGGTSTNSGEINSQTSSTSYNYKAYAGGFAGYVAQNIEISGGIIRNSNNVYANCESSSSDSFAGGLAGYVVNGLIVGLSDDEGEQLELTGTVGANGSNRSDRAGGLVASVGGVYITDLSGLNNSGLTVTASRTAGGLVGLLREEYVYNDGSTHLIKGATNNATVEASNYAGGFVGTVGDSNNNRLVVFENVINNASVTATYGAGCYAGGLIGCVDIETELNKVSNSGTISAGDAGGLIGRSEKVTITAGSNENSGEISASTYAGGFVGIVANFDPNLESDFLIKGGINTNSGDVVGDRAGGFVGCVFKGNLEINGGTNTNTAFITTSGETSTTGTEYAGGFAGSVGFSSNNVGNFIISGGTNINNGEVLAYNTRKDTVAGGFAGYVGGYASIKSTEAITNDGNIGSNSCAGGFFGYIGSYLTISDFSTCINKGGVGYYIVSESPDGNIVLISYLAGGVAGYVRGNLEISNYETYNRGRISASNTNEYTYAGGFTGYVGGNALIHCEEDAMNSGIITSDDYAGGFIGKVAGDLTISGGTNTNSGNVTGTTYVGGFIGYVEGNTIISGETNTNSGNVTGTNAVGGFVGYAVGNVTISGTLNSNSGNISGDWTGGLVGVANGNVTIVGDYNKNAGNINARTEQTNDSIKREKGGGFAGKVWGVFEIKQGENISIGNVYGLYNVGGFVGDCNACIISGGEVKVSALEIKTFEISEGHAGGIVGSTGNLVIENTSGKITIFTKTTDGETPIISGYNAGGYAGTADSATFGAGGAGRNEVTSFGDIEGTYFGGFIGYCESVTVDNSSYYVHESTGDDIGNLGNFEDLVS